MRRALAALALAGCVPSTGVIAEVAGPDGVTSLQAGVSQLDFVTAHASWCERWVGVAPAMHTIVDVSGRDLAQKPYEFQITPSHQTDLSEPVYIAALAYAADGRLLGEASFDAHPMSKDQVLKRSAKIALFAYGADPNGPRYVSPDGCVCVPGQPWVGTGNGVACDTRVITSFERLVDTAGCELTPRGAPLPLNVCDGQRYGDEVANRDLPCWANDGKGACRLTRRRCADDGGVAYAEECTSGGGDAALPSAAMCDRYRACERDACTDVLACVRASFATKMSATCTVRVDPSTKPNEKIRPCPASGASLWSAQLPAQLGTDCVAAILDGVSQPPLTVGFAPAMPGKALPIADKCPDVLQIDSIDAPYPDALPATKEVDLVVGEHLVHVTFKIDRSCTGAAPPLVCVPN